MKFLIIEDDPTAQLLLKKISEDYGDAILASNGLEALDIINHSDLNSFDVIFLDIMMPEMDGIEFLETLRKIEKDKKVAKRKVIIVSALEAEKTIIPKFAKDNNITYLVKPINKTKIIEILESLKN
jgi:two-component system chemotaxis response regulator CheY